MRQPLANGRRENLQTFAHCRRFAGQIHNQTRATRPGHRARQNRRFHFGERLQAHDFAETRAVPFPTPRALPPGSRRAPKSLCLRSSPPYRIFARLQIFSAPPKSIPLHPARCATRKSASSPRNSRNTTFNLRSAAVRINARRGAVADGKASDFHTRQISDNLSARLWACAFPLLRPADTFSATGGEGRDEGACVLVKIAVMLSPFQPAGCPRCAWFCPPPCTCRKASAPPRSPRSMLPSPRRLARGSRRSR